MALSLIHRCFLLGSLLCLMLGTVLVATAATPTVVVLEVTGPITPTVAGYLDRGIEQAEREGAAAVVVQLDTPGGLDDSTRKIMQRIMASRVPVIVYVYPPGGRAASAGLFITQAAHVAAMAPNTNIGSAHPVQLGGGQAGGGEQDKTLSEKIENDAAAIVRSVAQTRGRNAEWVERAVRESVNVSAREALELNVIEVVAEDYPSLLRQVSGRQVELAGGQSVTLQVADAELRQLEMTWAERLIQTISDPNIAYLLLTIGMYGLIYELANPGTWFPGVIGTVALVVALYALGTLPVNWAGVALIVLAFGLFVGDILVAGSQGGLTAAGIITLLLGSLFLFSGGGPELQVSPWVIAGVVGSTTLFFVFVVGAVYRSYQRAPVTGTEALVGQPAIVHRDLAPAGTVEMAGELWQARLVEGLTGPIPRGQRVRVVDVQGLVLTVAPAT